MGKRQAGTTNSQIRSALRRLFLRSRERGARIKYDKYTCCRCGAKQSKARGREIAVEVHHLEGVENWPELFRVVREYLLCSPDKMETLCVSCHKDESKTAETFSGIIGE